MRTICEIYFHLAGLKRSDQFALHSNDEVANATKELCTELANRAKEVLGDVQWSGDFPQFPKDRLQYEQYIQHVLAPATLRSVATAIGPVFEKLRTRVTEASQFIDRPTTSLSEAKEVQSPWTYELQSREASLCIPCDPPPGCHICEISLFYSVPGGTPIKLKWPIQSKNDVYSYTVNGSLRFRIGE